MPKRLTLSVGFGLLLSFAALQSARANAVDPTCSSSTTASAVEGAGFSCTLDGLIFSNFHISTQLGGATPVSFRTTAFGPQVSFGIMTSGNSSVLANTALNSLLVTPPHPASISYTVTSANSLVFMDDAQLVNHGVFPMGNSHWGSGTTTHFGSLTLQAGCSNASPPCALAPGHNFPGSVTGNFSQLVDSVSVSNMGTVNPNSDNVTGTNATLTRLTQIRNGFSTTVVPEPSTWSLMAIGFAVMAGLAYRRRKLGSVA